MLLHGGFTTGSLYNLLSNFLCWYWLIVLTYMLYIFAILLIFVIVCGFGVIVTTEINVVTYVYHIMQTTLQIQYGCLVFKWNKIHSVIIPPLSTIFFTLKGCLFHVMSACAVSGLLLPAKISRKRLILQKRDSLLKLRLVMKSEWLVLIQHFLSSKKNWHEVFCWSSHTKVSSATWTFWIVKIL